MVGETFACFSQIFFFFLQDLPLIVTKSEQPNLEMANKDVSTPEKATQTQPKSIATSSNPVNNTVNNTTLYSINKRTLKPLKKEFENEKDFADLLATFKKESDILLKQDNSIIDNLKKNVLQPNERVCAPTQNSPIF